MTTSLLAAPSVAQLLQSGVAQHEAGAYDRASALYQQVLSIEPQNVDAWHLLGLIAYEKGEHERAVSLILKALQVLPAAAEIHSNLGNIYAAMGKLEAAAASLQQAVACDPSFAEGYSNLGNVRREMRLPLQAEQDYRRALALNPNYAQAHYNLGLALQDQQRDEEAIACYRRALRLAPDYAEAHNNLGLMLQTRGDTDDACEAFQAAVRIKPGYAEAHNNLATLLQDQGKTDFAVKHYQQALALRPDYLLAHSNLGTAYHDQGDFKRAIACYKTALQIAPDGGIYQNLGAAWQDAGDSKHALECFRNALQLTPGNSAALSSLSWQLQHACDWQERAALVQQLLTPAHLKSGLLAPFSLLSLPLTASQQRTAVEHYCRHEFRHVQPLPRHVEGQLQPLNSFGTPSYGLSAPLTRQRGNSLVNIADPAQAGTANGILFGLASRFREINLTGVWDYTGYDPIHVIVSGDYVKNIGFDSNEIFNRTNLLLDKRTKGYQTRLTLGMPQLGKKADWQVFGGYRYLERDAVLDAFTASDFHLGGTDTKGYFLGGSYGLANNTWLTLRWMSADEIHGPPLAIDTLFIDLNAKF